MPVSQRGLQKRSKYQEDSTKVSIVSVSRHASPPQLGQDTRTNRVRVFSRDPVAVQFTPPEGLRHQR